MDKKTTIFIIDPTVGVLFERETREKERQEKRERQKREAKNSSFFTHFKSTKKDFST